LIAHTIAARGNFYAHNECCEQDEQRRYDTMEH